ncbi:MAG: TonB-dependent receptor [Planctomycetales bacterium]|nr:TonB-dependent receptor [Planctomycetales bacterium]
MFGAKRLKLRQKIATASAGLLVAAGSMATIDTVLAAGPETSQSQSQAYADYYAGSGATQHPLTSQKVAVSKSATDETIKKVAAEKAVQSKPALKQPTSEEYAAYFASTAPMPIYRTQVDGQEQDGVSMQFQHGQLVSMMQPEPIQSQQPIAPATASVTPTSFSPFGDLSLSLDAVAAGHSESVASGTPGDVVVGGEQAVVRASNDVGTILADSNQAINVSLFRRPNVTHPHIRGYNPRQIYTQMNGGNWIAARPDLDSIVSKIDAGIIEDVVIVKGPYSALYGPGLAFIDIVTAPTLRSGCCGGAVSEFRTVMNFETNGGGAYGRQVAEVGGGNWGARANFGFRGGVDYKSGNEGGGASVIDANYESRDIEFTLGYDIGSDQELEFQYVRQDTTDAIFHNQPLGIDALVTNGFSLRYEDYCPLYFDHTKIEAWYNDTRIDQDTSIRFLNPGNIPLVVDTVADTNQSIVGARYAGTLGDIECGCGELTVGADIRYTRHSIQETNNIFINGVQTQFDTPLDLPSGTDSINPGFFVQYEGRANCCVTYKLGGRLDYIESEVGNYRRMPNAILLDPTDRNFTLWSAFLTTKYEIDDVWSMTAGVGHGERAPSLVELYTDAPYISGFQTGLSRQWGNSNLREEQATQFDLGLHGEYCNAAFGGNAYYSWVQDYIAPTFVDGNETAFGFDHGYSFTNSDSSLWGIEVNGVYDLTDSVSVFGNLAYNEGRDQDLFNDHVYGIYPLQSRVGVRYERGNQCRGFGMELSARMVADQELLADGDRFINGAGYVDAMGGPEQRTPGFTTFDLRTFYRYSQNALFSFGVMNFGDAQYFEHFDYRQNPVISRGGKGFVPSYQPGINFYFGTELTF